MNFSQYKCQRDWMMHAANTLTNTRRDAEAMLDKYEAVSIPSQQHRVRRYQWHGAVMTMHG